MELTDCAIPWKPIWLDPLDNLFAIVSPEDYEWAIQWRWAPLYDRHGRKVYATRMSSIGRRSWSPNMGSRSRGGVQIKIFLHKHIVLRALGTDSNPRRNMGDHRDGNSLDCRRHNLRWATPSENRRNINGVAAELHDHHPELELA